MKKLSSLILAFALTFSTALFSSCEEDAAEYSVSTNDLAGEWTGSFVSNDENITAEIKIESSGTNTIKIYNFQNLGTTNYIAATVSGSTLAYSGTISGYTVTGTGTIESSQTIKLKYDITDNDISDSFTATLNFGKALAKKALAK